MPSQTVGSLRCAEVTRSAGVDPIGTAGGYDGYLLVEWPLPWPRDLGEVGELGPVHEALAGRGIRLQGLVPRSSDPGARHVVLYRRRPGEGFGGYARTERVVAADEEVAAAVALLDDPGTPAWLAADVDHDVLVCTHGRRDACCGKLGTALALELAVEPELLGAGMRVWRTSHTGGHRFAPTALVLPEGTAWAFVDKLLLQQVVARQGDLGEVLAHYRGCAGLPPRAQVAERQAFAEVGWGWLDHRRWAEDLGGDRLRLRATAPDGTALAWEAVVEQVGTAPVPDCGKPLEEAKKSEPVLELTRFARVEPPPA